MLLFVCVYETLLNSATERTMLQLVKLIVPLTSLPSCYGDKFPPDELFSKPPAPPRFICQFALALLGSTPAASGHNTWTEGINHYITALLLPLPHHSPSSQCHGVACPYRCYRGDVGPLDEEQHCLMHKISI